MSLVERGTPVAQDWAGGMASPGDYFALLKPRVMYLVVFTALAGVVMAPGTLHPLLAAFAVLCIAVGAGASGALNMWYDADIDRLMSRTAERPIPAGKVGADEALAFGMALSVGSVALLGLVIGWLPAALLAFTIFFYVVIYTMWLKRSTPQNIVIGGAAGAFPPMIGWACVTGSISIESIVMFAIIFLWTPAHFWALALLKVEDYARAGVPMMPNALGPDVTRSQILIYTVLTAVSGLVPTVMGFAGLAYAAVALVLGLGFVRAAWAVYRVRTGGEARKAAGKLFGFSIVYLFALFAALMVEHIVLKVLG
jgi:protoheme IX farnesyltransferase